MIRNIEAIGRKHIAEQYGAYKKMYLAQPQRVRELFTDKITELRRKN